MKLSGDSLPEAVRRIVIEQGRFKVGDTVVVAVSGGPDSTALLHALVALCGEWGVHLVGAHLNHGFRGAEADGDAGYVLALCSDLGIACHCERYDVPALQRRRHLSSQAAAREVRHAFLRRVAADVGAAHIALGHTRDDRIETVLLHILRGAGIDGLAGITASEPPLIRPLLYVSRAETAAYCALHALQPRQDSSNLKTDYRRNRMRAELLPHLASYYNQCVGDSLLRLSELAAADSDLLNALAREALQTVTVTASGVECVLDAGALSHLPLALQRRVLRFAIMGVRGDLRDVGMEATERILDALAAGQQESVTLPACETASVEVKVSGPILRIYRLSAAAQRLPWSYALSLPGETALPEAALVLETRLCPTPTAVHTLDPAGENSLVYAVEQLMLPLTVRSWQPGDRMRPRGLGGSKKLQDLFTDRKIRGEERRRFPILTDATGRVLAVIGLQADETALRRPAAPDEPLARGETLCLMWRQESFPSS